MKKISIIFLILFTLLTFSNVASASFFSDVFSDVFKELFGESDKSPWNEKRGGVNNVRCKVEYTQLDLATGLEKTVKHTVQYEIRYLAIDTNVMYLSVQDLTSKINDWINESKNNVITNLTGINCKERIFYINQINTWKSELRWSKYKSCADEFNAEFMNLLNRPKQWGYNVHKERLIKDYDDGCQNYSGK
jgi:hypothetical protein